MRLRGWWGRHGSLVWWVLLRQCNCCWGRGGRECQCRGTGLTALPLCLGCLFKQFGWERGRRVHHGGGFLLCHWEWGGGWLHKHLHNGVFWGTQ